MGGTLSAERIAARVAMVNKHVEAENQHNLEAVMETFNDSAEFHIQSGNEFHIGNDNVRSNYADLFRGIPDVHIEIKHRYITDEILIEEIMFRGTHLGTWRGIPATGKKIDLPICTLFWFDDNDKLCGERIYFDGALLMQQLGLLPTNA